ncbi:MAG: SGNH/GDSL hydrolase family protein [Ruminococcaceae bacterium]|nr:SGNH/GDSL hydrolase family protein [Oscillospiraceae bacterium]
MELTGKKVAFLGDSITEGAGVVDCARNRYDNVFARLCGLRETYSDGIGGSRLAHQWVPSEEPRRDLCFCGRAFNIPLDADAVVVYGGVNDYFHGDAPIGEKGDRTPATFRGAVWFLMNTLKTRFAGKPVVFMTPARCFYKGIPDTEASTRPMKRPDAMPVLGYVEIIKEIGAELGVAVLDLYHTFEIDPNDAELREKYTKDGLHFNDAGHVLLAGHLKKFFDTL